MSPMATAVYPGQGDLRVLLGVAVMNGARATAGHVRARARNAGKGQGQQLSCSRLRTFLPINNSRPRVLRKCSRRTSPIRMLKASEIAVVLSMQVVRVKMSQAYLKLGVQSRNVAKLAILSRLLSKYRLFDKYRLFGK